MFARGARVLGPRRRRLLFPYGHTGILLFF
jgi:hypothetical protein